MHHHRAFIYNDWANREELARLRQLAAPPGAALRVFAHIVAVEWLWLARLGWKASDMSVWPELTLERCAIELDWLRDAWRVVLRDADPTGVVEYRNSRGETWTNVTTSSRTFQCMARITAARSRRICARMAMSRRTRISFTPRDRACSRTSDEFQPAARSRLARRPEA